MRLFEYQAKEVFSKHGISIPKGETIESAVEVVDVIEKIGYPVALKAQVLTGGRGKLGGVKFVTKEEEIKQTANELLNMSIKGINVDKLLVEEKLSIKREIYISITMDRAMKKPVLVVSAEGGVDIEKLAKSKPESIFKTWIDPVVGLYSYHGVSILKKAGFEGETLRDLSIIVAKLYKIFVFYECELVEINPLVITSDNSILAADGKMMIDENGSGMSKLGFKKEESMRYVELSGDIGILANGAGLTMMTMDMVSHFGGEPSNFLEVGGELYKKSEEALMFLLEKKELNGILVNLFGAYARTDVIVEGIIRGLKESKIKIPIVFRIRGTGEERARILLKDELGLESYTELDEATKVIVEKSSRYKRGELYNDII